MPRHLLHYADRIAARKLRRRSLRALETVLTDEYLARDIGLPARMPKKIGVLPW